MQYYLSDDRDYEVWMLLSQASDAMFKAREKELNGNGVTAMEATALFIIQAIGDQATPAEISRWILREPHSVSGLLDRMERRGLIKRTKDLEWKNMVRVTVTEKGKEVYEMSTARESIHNTLSVLPAEEYQQLSSYLRTLRDKALQQINIGYEMPFP